MFGAVPGVAQLATELRGYTDRGQVSELWHAVSQAMTQAEQGEADKAAVKATIKLGGLATGLPSRQVNKTIEAVAKGQNGEDVTPWEYLNGPKREK